jgi:hypothetical protein
MVTNDMTDYVILWQTLLSLLSDEDIIRLRQRAVLTLDSPESLTLRHQLSNELMKRDLEYEHKHRSV